MASKGRPYRTFQLEGFEVLVGRGEEDNDFLTFEVADKHDLWMHVAGGTPGSHVVVRNPDRVEVPRPILEGAEFGVTLNERGGVNLADAAALKKALIKVPPSAPKKDAATK